MTETGAFPIRFPLFPIFKTLGFPKSYSVILLHFNNSQPETLVFLPPLIISKDEIKYFLESTKKIIDKGLLKIFIKFVIGNIK